MTRTATNIGFSGADMLPNHNRFGVVGSVSRGNLLGTLFASLVLSGGAIVQVDTLTVDTASNDTAYTYVCNGETITYTSDSSATKAEIVAGLVAAHNANPVAGQVAFAAGSGDDVVLTGRYPGMVFTTTESDSNLSLVNTTAAGSHANVPVGRAVAITERRQQSAVGGAYDEGAAAQTTIFSAQVDTWTLTYDQDVECVVEIVFKDGRTYRASAFMVTSLDNATDELAAAVNAAVPANTVAATETATELILTAENVGEEFTSRISFRPPTGAVVDTGAASLDSSAALDTSLHQALAGFTLLDGAVPVAEQGEPVWRGGQIAPVISKGFIWLQLESGETPAAGGQVFIELDATGSAAGRAYSVTGTKRVAMPTTRMSFTGRYSATDLVAEVELS